MQPWPTGCVSYPYMLAPISSRNWLFLQSCSLLARAAFAVTCLQYVVWAGKPHSYFVYTTVSNDLPSVLRFAGLRLVQELHGRVGCPSPLVCLLRRRLREWTAFIAGENVRPYNADCNNTQSDFHFDLDGVNIPLLGCTATTAIPNALFQKYVISLPFYVSASDHPPMPDVHLVSYSLGVPQC